jgi:hypothetical protein
MPKSFCNFSTYSEGKKLTEEKLDSILQAFRIREVTGWAFFLVGQAKTSYERHYKRAVEELGFNPSQVVFVEWDEKTYVNLMRYKHRHGYKNQVVMGDIIEVIKQFAERDPRIIYVEADGVEAFGKLDLQLYKLCKDYKIPFMSINGTTRRPSKEFTLEAAKLSIRRTVDKRWPHKGPRYDMKRIIPIIAKSKLPKSCEFSCETYWGRSGMYLSTIINKKWIK